LPMRRDVNVLLFTRDVGDRATNQLR
jgi:hypothetical protein